MKYWLLTDTHFGHDMLVDKKLRPAHFEDRVLKALKNMVGNKDVLIHLGDIFFKDVDWHVKLMEIPCKKWLLLGNHDKGASWYLDHGWDFAADTITMNIYGHHILLSHVPKKDDGVYTINIHGHYHNFDHHKYEPEFVAIANEKHCVLSLETINYQPVLLQTVVEAFNKRIVTVNDPIISECHPAREAVSKPFYYGR